MVFGEKGRREEKGERREKGRIDREEGRRSCSCRKGKGEEEKEIRKRRKMFKISQKNIFHFDLKMREDNFVLEKIVT